MTRKIFAAEVIFAITAIVLGIANTVMAYMTNNQAGLSVGIGLIIESLIIIYIAKDAKEAFDLLDKSQEIIERNLRNNKKANELIEAQKLVIAELKHELGSAKTKKTKTK